MKDHNGRDKHSLVHKHAVEFNHKEVDLQQIEILGLNYGNKFRRKIAEALFIRGCRPTLTVESSFCFEHFNTIHGKENHVRIIEELDA